MASEATMTDVHKRAKNLTAWLKTVTRHRIADWWREHEKVEIVPIDPVVDTEGDGEREKILADIAARKNENAGKDPRMEAQLGKVKQALLQLTRAQRFVMNLHYCKNMRYNEIAKLLSQHPELCQELGLDQEPNEENIKVLCYKARKKLKKCCGVEDSDNG